MKNILKNAICIDLTQFNHAGLAKVVAEYPFISLNMLVGNKDNGFAKLFIDKFDGLVIAYTTKKDKTIVFSTEFTNLLSSMTTITITKEDRVLELDAILEKISKYGKDSLKKDEIDFLNNLN
jgi:hypothetical protein